MGGESISSCKTEPIQGMPYTQTYAHKGTFAHVLNETLQGSGDATEKSKHDSILNLSL